jgi:hypothetical protein
MSEAPRRQSAAAPTNTIDHVGLVVDNPVHVRRTSPKFIRDPNGGTLEMIVDASGAAEIACYWGAEPGEQHDQFRADSVFKKTIDKGLGQSIVFADLPKWKTGSTTAIVAKGTEGDSQILCEVTHLAMEGVPPELTVAKVETIRSNFENISYKTIELYDAVQKSLELGECVVCLENPADTVILWCGHLCLCKTCASVRNSSWSWMCAICRSAVKGTVQIEPVEMERLRNEWGSS